MGECSAIAVWNLVAHPVTNQPKTSENGERVENPGGGKGRDRKFCRGFEDRTYMTQNFFENQQRKIQKLHPDEETMIIATIATHERDGKANKIWDRSKIKRKNQGRHK